MVGTRTDLLNIAKAELRVQFQQILRPSNNKDDSKQATEPIKEARLPKQIEDNLDGMAKIIIDVIEIEQA